MALAAASACTGSEDLDLAGGDHEPTRDGDLPDGVETGPLLNECTAGDSSVATLRVTALRQGSAASSDVEPFPGTVDAVGGTCLTVSTEARGRWDDQRIVVQLYRIAGKEASDRDVVIDIANIFAAAASKV